MSPLPLHALPIAAAEETIRSLEFDLPDAAWQWALGGVAIVLLTTIVVALYVRDTASFSAPWRVVLTALRLAVFAGLLVIALNPQERTRRTSLRPSRVVVLADTSLSMRYPAGESTALESQQTRSDAVTRLLADSELIDQLRERHEVSLYSFDESLSGPHSVFRRRDEEASDETPVAKAGDTPDWSELLRPRGTETRLGESLREVIRQVNGTTLSGIVVLSDGGSNAGIGVDSAHDAAIAGNVRILSIGVGSTQPPINLQIANIQSPTDVQIGDPYEISAFVQGQGLEGRSVEVELLTRSEEDGDSDPISVAKQTVQLLEDGLPVEVNFERMPSLAGLVEFFVRARPASDVVELTQEDNERRKSVNVIDRKLRALLVAGGPMREYRLVRNMLYRHDAIELDVWLQTVDAASYSAVSQEADRLLLQFPETAAELYEYDVILAFDPDWRQIPPYGLELLNKWVATHGGGLVLVAGDVHTADLAAAGGELEPVQDLYPVFLHSYPVATQIDGRWDQPWPLDRTLEGQEAGFLQLAAESTEPDQVWDEFPGIYRCYPTAGAKAGATVYAHFSDPREQTEYGAPVLLASQFYGSGRTLYLGSPEIWRLRALDEEYYERFWTKLVREVGQGRLRRGTARGMLLLERNQYVLGQTVRIRANLLDPQLQPLEAAEIPMEIYDPDGRPLLPERRLRRDANRPGQFVGDFRANSAGTYSIRIAVPGSVDQPASGSNEELSAKIDVVLPNLESDNPRQNARLLTDLARDTGGGYLTLLSAEREVPGMLPNRSEEFLLDEMLRALWDREWLLYLLVALLSLEWLTRKFLKLA